MDTLTKGILWFDNSSIPLKNKYARAALYYYDKYKVLPDICYVNPSMIEPVPDHLNIRPLVNVMPGYLWIGIK